MRSHIVRTEAKQVRVLNLIEITYFRNKLWNKHWFYERFPRTPFYMSFWSFINTGNFILKKNDNIIIN